MKVFVRKLEVNGKEIFYQANVNGEIKTISEEVFKCNNGKSFTNLSIVLNTIDLPCLSNEQKDFYEIKLQEKKIFNGLQPMPNSKTPVNGGLRKEFYKAFWKGLKDCLLKSFYYS